MLQQSHPEQIDTNSHTREQYNHRRHPTGIAEHRHQSLNVPIRPSVDTNAYTALEDSEDFSNSYGLFDECDLSVTRFL